MKRIKQVIVFTLIVSLLSGCAAIDQMVEAIDQARTEQSKEDDSSNRTERKKKEDSSDVEEQSEEESENVTKVSSGLYSGERPILIQNMEKSESGSITPCVTPYIVERDLSNIDNLWQFYIQDDMADKLVQNGFVVCGEAGSEFFEIYEQNRYNMIPNFVTVDSLMHTYHLYFSYLLKNIEKDYLFERITQLSKNMLDNSIAQYEQLKGSKWENAAKRNVAFFTIGAKLLNDSTVIYDDVTEIVQYELDNIDRADSIYESKITGEK